MEDFQISKKTKPRSDEPNTEETLLELAADWEYRLCMIEMGLI